MNQYQKLPLLLDNLSEYTYNTNEAQRIGHVFVIGKKFNALSQFEDRGEVVKEDK
jgi:hypothetical protein